MHKIFYLHPPSQNRTAGNRRLAKLDYAMVVIDEAHNLRNPGTQRAEALRLLMAGCPPKKHALLTATPVKTVCGTCITNWAPSSTMTQSLPKWGSVLCESISTRRRRLIPTTSHPSTSSTC